MASRYYISLYQRLMLTRYWQNILFTNYFSSLDNMSVVNTTGQSNNSRAKVRGGRSTARAIINVIFVQTFSLLVISKQYRF